MGAGRAATSTTWQGRPNHLHVMANTSDGAWPVAGAILAHLDSRHRSYAARRRGRARHLTKRSSL